MWVCPSCGSNSERVACWRCRVPRPASVLDEPQASSQWPAGAGTSSQAPPLQATPLAAAPIGYPGWNAAAPQQHSRRGWLLLVVALAFILATGFIALAHVVPIVRLGSTTALAAPASIDGLPRTADLSSQGVTVMGQRVLNVASATYGSGDVRYAVVAMSGPQVLGNSRVLVDAMAPQIAGDVTLDGGPPAHVVRGGIDYTCWRMNGTVAGATCEWDAGSVTGVIVQLGSADTNRCVAFAEAARHALQTG